MIKHHILQIYVQFEWRYQARLWFDLVNFDENHMT